MRRQAVPDQDETPTAKMTLESVQETDERDVVIAAGPRLEEETTAAAVPPECQDHGEGEEDDPGSAAPVIATAHPTTGSSTACRLSEHGRSCRRSGR